MKFVFLFLTLLILSCSTKEKKENITERTEITPEKVIVKKETESTEELSFEKIQDSLRILLLNSKPNENLKSSLLQELYIRELVDQIDNKIKFELHFNLHGFDCGAPDCYSTDIKFEIPDEKPIEFPKKIHFSFLEYGCGIESEIKENGIFKLVEQSPTYVNYYSKEMESNLVIIGDKKKLYYFPEAKPNLIKVEHIEKLIDEYNEENPSFVAPYQSTAMTTVEYENFMN